jgi:hypothetical protein
LSISKIGIVRSHLIFWGASDALNNFPARKAKHGISAMPEMTKLGNRSWRRSGALAHLFSFEVHLALAYTLFPYWAPVLMPRCNIPAQKAAEEPETAAKIAKVLAWVEENVCPR